MLTSLISHYPMLSRMEGELRAAYELLIDTFASGGKLLLCGNGGSAADCDHIAGELCKSFLKKRSLSSERRAAMRVRCPSLSEETFDLLEDALPTISLPGMTALFTAYANDKAPEAVFAQEVFALGCAGDTLLAISTSGNSKNILRAAEVARGLGLTVIALTGEGGGNLARLADVTLAVPERETYRVQELHLPIYHWLCAEVEAHFFGE